MRQSPLGGIMLMVPTRWRKTRVGKEEDILMSSAKENMALARRFLEARGRADLDALEHMMAPDFVDHTLTPSQQLDRESYKRSVTEYVSAFSDIRIRVEDQVASSSYSWVLHVTTTPTSLARPRTNSSSRSEKSALSRTGISSSPSRIRAYRSEPMNVLATVRS